MTKDEEEIVIEYPHDSCKESKYDSDTSEDSGNKEKKFESIFKIFYIVTFHL